MSFKIIDAHTHVQFEKYDNDRSAVIARALDRGIGMINAGADVESTKKGIELAHAYKTGVWATAGIHPTENGPGTFEDIAVLAQEPAVVGIGECGLDFYARTPEEQASINIAEQKELFQKHIELAHTLNKPLVIHCRQAFPEVIAMLQNNAALLPSQPGILHFFTGTTEDAQKLMVLGFYFTFNGLITFNREFDETIRAIGLNNILVETDAPWVAPKSHRGERNEPSYVGEVGDALALIIGEDRGHVEQHVRENTRTVFGI